MTRFLCRYQIANYQKNVINWIFMQYIVCKATLRDKRKFDQGIEIRRKTYSPPL